MKKILFLLMAFCTITLTASAQKKSDKPAPGNGEPVEDSLPYRKYPTLPAFKVLEMDSTTVFNTYNIPTGKPTVLMLFSPDCDHCKHLTEKLVKSMDSLKQIQFYLVTPVSSMTELRDFYSKFHLADYPNIALVGRDIDYFFFSFYGARFVPYLALYDKNKNLIKSFPDKVTVKDLYELTKNK